MKAMRVLIIDDDPPVRQTLCSTLEEDGQTWEVSDRDFDDLGYALSRFRPDLLVLDLLEGQSADQQPTGNEAFDEIRRTWFCPVVVYSAFPDQQAFNHPLVQTVSKGTGSEFKVLNHLKAFVRHAEMIRCVHGDFDARIREALRDSVEALSRQAEMTGSGDREVVVPRAVRRLVAARVDARVSGAGKLQAWERFIVPPLGNHLFTADLLRLNGGDGPFEEGDFRLVLTPTCDLVPGRNGEHDVEQVVVARCEKITKLGKIDLESAQGLSGKQKESLRPGFTEGLIGHLLPIPAFRDHVPMMVANLGRLEILKGSQVEVATGDGSEPPMEGRFRRVASTDSPFREMVVWAYLRVIGRPGLPEIDVDSWLETLSAQLSERVES